jgi:hypothetical protein
VEYSRRFAAFAEGASSLARPFGSPQHTANPSFPWMAVLSYFRTRSWELDSNLGIIRSDARLGSESQLRKHPPFFKLPHKFTQMKGHYESKGFGSFFTDLKSEVTGDFQVYSIPRTKNCGTTLPVHVSSLLSSMMA